MLDTPSCQGTARIHAGCHEGRRRGGRIVNIGGTAGDLPVELKWWMDEQMIDRLGRFTAARAWKSAAMVESGAIDLSPLTPMVWPLEQINEAINGVTKGDGGSPSMQ